ncbi:MAG: system Fe-S cluster assembly regulator [Gammaproteobacteria bacterium]|jgi:FeS assembly SUF system regulator|nr:system Fe-S cluster assembly regulator [Gammaproteobacteria bacterium]
MLRISKLADYGTVILTLMARTPSKHFAASELAELSHLPLPTTSKILKILTQAGILLSLRGMKGGYLLAHAPDQIAITDIISALDGDMALTTCTTHDKICDLQTSCHIRANWQVINAAVYGALKDITLADMIMPMPARSVSIDTIRRHADG